MDFSLEMKAFFNKKFVKIESLTKDAISLLCVWFFNKKYFVYMSFYEKKFLKSCHHWNAKFFKIKLME